MAFFRKPMRTPYGSGTRHEGRRLPRKEVSGKKGKLLLDSLRSPPFRRTAQLFLQSQGLLRGGSSGLIDKKKISRLSIIDGSPLSRTAISSSKREKNSWA